VGEESVAPSSFTMAEDWSLNCESCSCRTGWVVTGDETGAVGDRDCDGTDAAGWGGRYEGPAGSCDDDCASRCAVTGVTGVNEKKLMMPMMLNLRAFCFIFYLVAVADKCNSFSVRRPGWRVDRTLATIHIGKDLGFALSIDGQQPDIDMLIRRMDSRGRLFL